MRPRRGCAAGSHAGCARVDCWCESAANAPPGRRSKRVSPRLPLPPARRRGSGAGHAASRSLGWPSRGARTTMIQLAWLWLRYQPGSELAEWFRKRVGTLAGRTRRIAIVAMARKLLIALWRYVETGVLPAGAEIRPESVAAA